MKKLVLKIAASLIGGAMLFSAAGCNSTDDAEKVDKILEDLKQIQATVDEIARARDAARQEALAAEAAAAAEA